MNAVFVFFDVFDVRVLCLDAVGGGYAVLRLCLMVFGEENLNLEGLRSIEMTPILHEGGYYNDSVMNVAHPRISGGKGDVIGTFHGDDVDSGTTNVGFVDGHVGSYNPSYDKYAHDGRLTFNVPRLAFDSMAVDVSGPTGRIVASRSR